MHGNPVAVESVQSVRAFARFLVRSGLDDAIRSIAEGRPVLDLLRASETHRRAVLDGLRGGEAFSHSWRTSDDEQAV
jgi:hypothetical protein